MKRLLPYFKKYRLRSVTAPLFKCFEACFELLIPLVVSDMIDKGIGGADTFYIISRGLLLLLLAVVGLLCAICAQYFAATAAAGIGRDISNDLFSHIMTLGYKEIDEVGTAKLLTRISSDVTRVQNGINMFLRLFMRSPFIVFGAVIMAFTVDIRAALVFVVMVPVLMVIVFGILIGTMPYYKKVQGSLDKVTLLTKETLSGQRVIRAFNRQEKEKEDFKTENDRLVSFQLFAGKISALMNPLTTVVVDLCIVCLLYTGAVRVNVGGLSQGDTIALINYMNQILTELIKLADLIILISRALSSMNRINEIMDIHVSMEDMKASDTTEKTDAFIAFQDVSFAYPGHSPALSDISFEVSRGESIGVIGGTGAGKTTLIDLIPRYYDVTDGRVLIEGRDIRGLHRAELRKRVGVVPQKAELFAMSLRDNLKLGNESATDEELIDAMEKAQASEILSLKEGGLDAWIEQDGRNLSGGQRQRVTIARALAKSPEVLILDDSASALDLATDARLRRALKDLRDRPTVFIVSQRVSAVRDCDKIIVLSNGHIEGIGSHKTLIKDCHIYREICESQMTREEVERDEKA